MTHESHFCEVCDEQTLHVKGKSSHILHLLLTLLTAGLWAIVWIFLVMRKGATRARCALCGTQRPFRALWGGANTAALVLVVLVVIVVGAMA